MGIKISKYMSYVNLFIGVLLILYSLNDEVKPVIDVVEELTALSDINISTLVVVPLGRVKYNLSSCLAPNL